MKDIRYLSLCPIFDVINKNTYYVIDGQKCDNIINIKTNKLIIVDIACKELNVDNIYIGKAYDDKETEIVDCYGVYYPRAEEENVSSSKLVSYITGTIKSLKQSKIMLNDIITYKYKMNLQ